VLASRILREMQQLPREPAGARFELVMQRVAQQIAPEDPLARGVAPGVSPPRNRSRAIGLSQLIALGLVLFFVLAAAAAGCWGSSDRRPSPRR